MNIRRLIRISLMTAILAVLTQISLPIGPVPFTLQTLAVLLSGFILGPRDGFISVLVYLLLGALGVPVFAGFSGGLDKLLGPTGGYLFSFLFTALISGYIYNKAPKRTSLYIAGLISFALTHGMGIAWFIFITKMPLAKAVPIVFYPFVIPDIVKIAIAVNLGFEVRRRILSPGYE